MIDERLELTVAEERVLGGVLRFATRFDGLDARARKAALAAASDELGYRATETRRVASERAGYRDAAIVVEVVSSGLDRLLDQATRELPSDRALREAILAVERPAVRVAIVRAVETLARHGGLARSESLFLDWLCSVWSVEPVTGWL